MIIIETIVSFNSIIMTSNELKVHIINFFQHASSKSIELYNEFSLQHELGIYFRSLPQFKGYNVQFERNIGFFFNVPLATVKKEIDIVVYNDKEKFAIELKFPRNGAYPRRMFQFIEDICFVKQLRVNGFDGGCAVVLVDDPKFYSAGRLSTQGIYAYFRGQSRSPIKGTIVNPIKDDKTNQLTINGSFRVKWDDVIIVDRDKATKATKSIPAKYYIVEI